MPLLKLSKRNHKKFGESWSIEHCHLEVGNWCQTFQMSGTDSLQATTFTTIVNRCEPLDGFAHPIWETMPQTLQSLFFPRKERRMMQFLCSLCQEKFYLKSRIKACAFNPFASVLPLLLGE